MKRTTILAAKIVTLLAVVPALIQARSAGPDPRYTGAPGDQNCTSCHSGSLNPSTGSVQVRAAEGSTYTPGQRQRITVTVNAEPAARIYGFQATARLESDLSNGQAGTLQPANGETFVQCDDASTTLPCRTSAAVQFIQHSLAKAGNTYEFDWTPPATAAAGNVRIYVAGNAANGNNTESGDRIFTTSITLTPNAQSGGPRPTIRDNGVENGGSFTPGFAPLSWVTIKGSNLSTTTRTWLASDFTNGQAPTTLDGVRVNIDGKPAAVYYISPAQINVQAPVLDKTGPVAVEVINANGTSNTVSGEVRRAAPSWLMFDPDGRKYIAGLHTDFTLLGRAGLFGPNATTRPAKPGDVVILFGTNFGPTNPPLPFAREASGLTPLADAPRVVTIGGVNATVGYGGGAPNLIGTYQFNIVVPDLPNGDHQVVVETAGGARTQENAFITIQR